MALDMTLKLMTNIDSALEFLWNIVAHSFREMLYSLRKYLCS